MLRPIFYCYAIRRFLLVLKAFTIERNYGSNRKVSHSDWKNMMPLPLPRNGCLASDQNPWIQIGTGQLLTSTEY